MIGISVQGGFFEGIKVFFRWWGKEILGLLPTKWRAWLFMGGNLPVLAVTGADLLLFDPKGKTLGRFDGGEKNLEAVARALAEAGLSKRIVLQVPEEWLLAQESSFPWAAEADLGSAVALEVARRTPFDSASLMIAHRVMGRDPQKKRLQVFWCALPKAKVSSLLLGLEKAGLVACEVHAPGFEANLLRQGPSGRGPWVVAALGCLFLWMACWMPVAAKSWALSRLQEEVARAAEGAKKAQVLAGKRDALAHALAEAQAMKAQAPSAVAVLEEISSLLPDDTWIYMLRLSEGEAQLWGMSRSASNLISRFEKAKTMKEAVFASPLTQDPKSSSERFLLQAKLVAAAPEASSENTPRNLP